MLRQSIAASVSVIPMPGASPELPLAGLLLGDVPRQYVELLNSGGPPPDGTGGLGLDERAFFSRDWSVVATTRTEKDTRRQRVSLPSGNSIAMDGRLWLQPIDSARVLAITAPPGEFDEQDEEQPSTVRLLGPTGEELLTVEGLDPSWVDASEDGRLVAVGAFDATRVHSLDGALVCEVNGESMLGVVSSAWLLVERLVAERTELVIRGVTSRDGEEHVFPVDPGMELCLDRARRRAIHVSPGTVRFFALDDPPREIGRRASSAGREWRGGAFDGSGRLALSWISIERPLESVASKGGPSRIQGRARAGVEVYAPGAEPEAPPVEERSWAVDAWNASSPEVAFDKAGHLYSIVGPLAFKVL